MLHTSPSMMPPTLFILTKQPSLAQIMRPLFLDMPYPMVTPEGTTVTTSTQSSETSLIPDPASPKTRLPKARVFIHRLPKNSFSTTSERYAFDDDFPSIAASDSTHVCFLPRRDTLHDSDRTSFRDRLRRLSKRGDSCDDSIIEDFREKRRQVGCAEFITHWFGRKEKDLDPPVCNDTPSHDINMFTVVGYDDFMHGGRRPSAAARMMARIRGA